MGWWVTTMWNEDPALFIAWSVWVIFSISLHELAHGWAALRRGDRTPIELGHMTWNPVVHMGTPSLIVFAILGIAWGAMPVNPSRMRGRYADAYVSFAGPAMNVGLAIVSSLCLAILARWTQNHYPTGDLPQQVHNLWTFFWVGASTNCVLAVFNLFPIPPLDGSRILADFWPRFRELIHDQRLMLIGLAVIIFVPGIIGESIWTIGFAMAERLLNMWRLVLG